MGGQPVAHANRCNCSCLNRNSGPKSRPGTIQCEGGIAVSIERELPCDRFDVVTELVACVPTTTERISSVITTANAITGAKVGGLTDIGTPVTCEDLAAGNVTGQRRVGNSSSVDQSLGDQNVPTFLECR